MTEILNSKKQVKARKDHVCDWCGEPIHRGETYDRDTIVCDGEIYTWHSHDECAKLASSMMSYFEEYEMTGHDFRDSLWEIYDDWFGDREKARAAYENDTMPERIHNCLKYIDELIHRQAEERRRLREMKEKYDEERRKRKEQTNNIGL